MTHNAESAAAESADDASDMRHPVGWDVTSDPDNPQPQIWPVCPTCDMAWVYRKFLSLGRGIVWAWGKDCKHKADPVLHTKDGLYDGGDE